MEITIDPSLISVALLAGGTSGEREISLASGDGALEALQEAGFKVSRFDPADKDDLKKLVAGDFDVAFLCVHGKNGEDGALQGFLEILGLPYIGSDVWSSVSAMDKDLSKQFYERAGLPIAAHVVINKGESYDEDEIVARVGYPAVVKPSGDGSSLGVYMVNSKEELDKALEEVFDIAEKVLVEAYIAGTELTVAVIGNDEPFALPVIQIIPKNEFYDFESKYDEGGSEHICPAPLDESVTRKVQDYAIEAHKALLCSGVSRTDFILDENGVPVVLETNTIPGMTKTSLLPDAARAAGIDFSVLCTMLVQYALEKNSKKN